jgi:hypothetical protein
MVLPVQVQTVEAVGKDTEGSADLVNHGRRVGGEMDTQHAGWKCGRSLQILA